MSTRLRLVHSHDEPSVAVHRNQFASRQSHLPATYFRESLGQRIERIGGYAVGIVMTLAAVVIVLGLAFGFV